MCMKRIMFLSAPVENIAGQRDLPMKNLELVEPLKTELSVTSHRMAINWQNALYIEHKLTGAGRFAGN